MSEPTKQRFYNIDQFKYGGTDQFNTLKSVSVSESTDFLTDSGDTDTQDTFVEKGKTSVNFSIDISDPIQAEAIKTHAKGDITFQGVPATGGVAVLVTIIGAVVGGRNLGGKHNAVWDGQLSGRATSVTVAPVGA